MNRDLNEVSIPPTQFRSQLPPAWKIAGASVTGVSHLKKYLPCQDVHQVHLLDNDVLLIVAADGAGTAARAEAGAQTAVKTAQTWLQSVLSGPIPTNEAEWEEVLTQTFLEARSQLNLQAAQEGLPIREFACTLVVAIAGMGWLVTGQVGDGAVVVLTQDGEIFTACPPQQGEYANETYFLVQDEGIQQFLGRVYGLDVAGLSVMTDGLVRLALQKPGHQPFAQFFNPLWQFISQITSPDSAEMELRSFLSSERVNARTDDDKTLVLAWRGTEFFNGSQAVAAEEKHETHPGQGLAR